jgi:hypothetical protein
MKQSSDWWGSSIVSNLCTYCGAKLPAQRGCVIGPPWCNNCQKTHKAQINKQMSKNIKDVLGIDLKFD